MLPTFVMPKKNCSALMLFLYFSPVLLPFLCSYFLRTRSAFPAASTRSRIARELVVRISMMSLNIAALMVAARQSSSSSHSVTMFRNSSMFFWYPMLLASLITMPSTAST